MKLHCEKAIIALFNKLTVPITLAHILSPLDKTSVASSTLTLDN